MPEEKESFWTIFFLKLVLVAVITFLAIEGTSWALDATGIVHPEWKASTILSCGLVFFIGSVVLVYSEEYRRESIYVFAFGFIIAVGCIALTLLCLLAYIPVPLFGNLFNLVFYLSPVFMLFLYLFLPVGDTTSSDGLISSSIKTPSPLNLPVFKRSPMKFKGMELVQIPHDYTLDEKENKSTPAYEQFISFTRHLSNSTIPFSLRIERNMKETRVLLLTWSRDENILSTRLSGLKDAIRANLPSFRFKSIGNFAGLYMSPESKAAYASITGVPLSLPDEGQTKHPLNGVAEVLSYINNAVVQVTVKPKSVSSSKLKSLEAEYRREIEASETTVSREKSGIFSGPRQESQVIVDPRAKRNAEVLKREIDRHSNPILCDTTVTVLSWNNTIEVADKNARRLANTLVGSLRPDDPVNEFKVAYKTKQKNAVKMMRGYTIGDESTLTVEEAACYFVLPTTDLGIKTTRRGKFSSGTESSTKSEKTRKTGPRYKSNVPTKIELLPRTEALFFGHPVDANGRSHEDLFISTKPQDLDSHIAVFGNTRSGKTTSAVSLIGQSIALGLNPIVLVPLKCHDWRVLLDIFPDIRVFSCGKNTALPLAFNFWNPPLGTPLSKWADRVIQFLTLWLPNDRILSMHVEDLVFTVYDNCGWDIATGKIGRPILLQDLVEAVDTVIQDLAYGDEVHANFRGALISRVKSLLRRPSLVKMFNTKQGMTIPELLSHPTIIEMDNLSGMDKVLLMGILTAAISEYKMANPSKGVVNLLVLEEAHYLLGRNSLEGEANSGARAQAVTAFIEMLRVLGGTGLGVVLIDQLPSSLVPEAVKLPVNAIIHALVDEDDRRLVGKHTRCTDEQIEHIAGMKAGETVVYLQREGEPKNVHAFSIDRFIAGSLEERTITDEMVVAHMENLYETDSGFFQTEPLPDDILDWVKHRRGHQKAPASGLSSKTQSNLEKAAANSHFREFCLERLSHSRDEDYQSLAKVICSLAKKLGDGTEDSINHLLSSVLRNHHAEVDEHSFERLVVAVQEALEA